MRKISFLCKIARCCVGVVLLCAMSCSGGGDEGNEPTSPNPPAPPEATKMPINISTNMWTRATDNGFEGNDQVGIYVVNYNGTTAGTLALSGNHADNVEFTYSSSAWNPATALYWKDQTTKSDFYCYYPYSSPTSISAHPFAVNTDQSLEANYKASDFLWGNKSNVSPTPNPVEIITKHTMSNILIYLKAGAGYTEESFNATTKSVTICNTKPNSTINLATGIVTATGEIAEITPKKESGFYRALIVPQTLTDIALVKVTINNDIYTLTQSMTFEANKQHSCTITVNRTGEGVNIGIGDWETDGEDHGGTVE